MIRQTLKTLDGKRFHCNAVVERFGTKRAYKGPPIKTVLLKNVTDPKTGDLLTDHLWFTAGKWADNLKPGDEIEFDARATTYIKGYRGRRDDAWDAPPVTQDWRLERPTKVRVLGQPDAPLFAGDLASTGFIENQRAQP